MAARRIKISRPVVSVFARLDVTGRPGAPATGWLRAGPLRMPVTLGRTGIRADKREGDGATPRGHFGLVRLWWRADRLVRPRTRLPVRAIRPDDGWCEDSLSRNYNRPIRLDRHGNGDRLRRQDRLYDLVVELDHNTRPRVAGRGSAVFIHVARPDGSPTAGCIGLRPGDLVRLLRRLGSRTRLYVH